MIAFDVFISYSSKDKPTADAACAAFEAAAIRCWIAPRDINPGADWGAAIVEAIDNCRMLVLIFSSHANESVQIRNEVVRAVGRGVPIVPVRIEDIMPTKSLAYYMGGVHWLDAMTPPLQKHLDAVVRAARTLLDQDSKDLPRVVTSGPGAGGGESSRSPPPGAARGYARVAAIAGMALTAVVVAAFSFWPRAPSTSATATVRAVQISPPPGDQEQQRVNALAAENGFVLPHYAIATPKGDVAADALKFVGIWASRTGNGGIGRQTMMIVTNVDGAKAEGFILEGKPGAGSWSQDIPAFTFPFVGDIADGALTIKRESTKTVFVAKFNLNAEYMTVLMTSQSGKSTEAVLYPIWRLTSGG